MKKRLFHRWITDVKCVMSDGWMKLRTPWTASFYCKIDVFSLPSFVFIKENIIHSLQIFSHNDYSYCFTLYRHSLFAINSIFNTFFTSSFLLPYIIHIISKLLLAEFLIVCLKSYKLLKRIIFIIVQIYDVFEFFRKIFQDGACDVMK